MASGSRDYPDWKAPSEDGGVVIWPQTKQILLDAIENQKRLSSVESSRLQNVPLREVRDRMRRFIGQESNQPLLAMGHQTELIHAGVWAKNALINAAAAKIDGQAFHIAVDTDAPKHLELRWPGQTTPISEDPHLTTAAWSGQLSPPTPAHLDEISSKLRAWQWDFQSMLPDVLASLKRSSLEMDVSLAAALANSQHELDWKLGLRQHVLLASPIWSCDPFLLFAYDMMARADSVAAHYNTALADYRTAHGITSHMRPMPDLFASEQSVEVPFWLDDLHIGNRTRPSVFRSDGGWILKLVGGEEFVFNPNLSGWEAAEQLRRWLIRTRHRIAPRLTLTMFLRLFMVDQFVHGIGGGRYDQVTDQFIAGHYGIEPPAFAVTTATMFFPAAIGRQQVCMPCVKQEGHSLKHGLLGERKRQLVEQIASLPRHSPQRTQAFYQMHSELAAAVNGNESIATWQRKSQELQEQHREEESLFDRELFYGLQSRERLMGMIERYRKEFADGQL